MTRIAKANVVDIKPKKKNAELARFDLLTSIYGMMAYHPMCRSIAGQDDHAFALLQAINFVKAGGLIFSSTFDYRDVASSAFRESGILEFVPEYGRLSYSDTAPPRVLRVVRHPTSREILKLLKIENSKEYSIL